MTEHDILGQVRSLVDQEHELRAKRATGEIDSQEEQAQLQSLEEALDQCWDLLRQRRAKTRVRRKPRGRLRPRREDRRGLPPVAPP